MENGKWKIRCRVKFKIQNSKFKIPAAPHPGAVRLCGAVALRCGAQMINLIFCLLAVGAIRMRFWMQYMPNSTAPAVRMAESHIFTTLTFGLSKQAAFWSFPRKPKG